MGQELLLLGRLPAWCCVVGSVGSCTALTVTPSYMRACTTAQAVSAARLLG